MRHATGMLPLTLVIVHESVPIGDNKMTMLANAAPELSGTIKWWASGERRAARGLGHMVRDVGIVNIYVYR